MEEQPSFYSIIPATVRYDDSICPNAKLLYGEITALCNKQGFCWANNKYFADIYKTSIRTIQRWIEQLAKAGYIFVNYDYIEGTNRIDSRCISLANLATKLSWGDDKIVMGVRQNCHGGHDKDVTVYPYYNNKTNNTFNNRPKEGRSGSFDPNEAFENFWVKYPKKVKKKKTQEKFIKICKTEDIFKDIMAGLEKYILSKDWKKDNGQFIPHPTTWLNGEMWNDEIEVSNSGECQKLYEEDEHGNKFDQFGNKIYE